MRFLVLKNPNAKEPETNAVTDFLYDDSVKLGEAPTCPRCGGYISLRPLLPPVKGKLELWGEVPGEICFSNPQLIVSDRVKHVFEEQRLVGMTFVPAEITKVTRRGGSRSRKDIPLYYAGTILRGRAAIDAAASELVRLGTSECDECREGGFKRIKRVVFEEGTWQGEDIFIPRGLSGTIVTSERFRDMCEENHIANALLIPAEEYSLDLYPWETKGRA